LLGLDCQIQTINGEDNADRVQKPPDLSIRREQVNSYNGLTIWLGGQTFRAGE
jgi:hypothetical protein